MKTRIRIGLCLLMLIPVTGKSQLNMEELKSVRKIVVSGAIQLELRRSDDYSLELKSPDLEMECLEHGIENGTLTLKLKSSFDCSGEVKAVLKIPEIRYIELMSKAELSTFNLLKTDSLSVIQRSASKSYLDLDVNYLDVQLSEGSFLSASGYVVNQHISVTTKANYSCLELEAENTEISASLLGMAKICVTDTLRASANSNSYILYDCVPDHTELKESLGGKIDKNTD